VEFAPLALPPQPRPLGLVPEPPSVEEKESLAAIRRGPVAPVQAGDPLARGPQSFVIARHALPGRIQPVGEDGKAKIAVRIRQVMHFEPLDLLLDFSAVR